MSIKISDIPAYTGTDIGETSLVGTVIEGGINVTKRIDTQAILDGIAALATDITGDFKGASDTFAGLPSSGNANGDYAILSVVDGSNPAGAYVWNGTDWVYSLPISAFGEIGGGTDEGEYDVPSPFASVTLDAWGVPISYITKAGVEVSALSQQVDDHEERLDALEGTVDLTPWQIAVGDTFLNGVDCLAGQSKMVDFKSYYPTGGSTGLHPLLIPESYFSYMFVIEMLAGVSRGSVYQPISEHRTTTGGRITYDGNGVPPERAISLMPLRATKDTGIDTQWTGSTPIGNFYNQASMPAFCKRRAELRAQKFTPVNVTRTYNAGANTTTLILQLTSGASVTYGLPERMITVEGSDQAAFNGTFYTFNAGNAFTTQFTVSGDIPLPSTTLTVYNHNVKERWVASASGEGGRPVRDFVKGAIFGRRREGYAQLQHDRAEKAGYAHASTVFLIRQGETDFVNPTTTNVTSTYKNTIIQMITDNNAAVKAITGQTFNPLYVCYQANGHRQYISVGNTNALMNVSQAHYELCKEGHCVASAPSMILSNEDGIHQTAEWSYILSMYEARAVEDMRVHGARRWVYPTSIVQTGTQIDVQFNVPYGNLTADNELYPLLTYWGFGTRSSNLINDLGLITGVSMLNSTTVRLTLSRALATGEWLDYGRGHGAANHEGYNITTDTLGAYGNLHDQFADDVYYFQQPTQGRFTRTSLTLRNYSYAFQSQCSAGGTFTI
jgi:hypothetical protein